MPSTIKILLIFVLFFVTFLGFDIVYHNQELASYGFYLKAIYWSIQNIFIWCLFWIFLSKSISNKYVFIPIIIGTFLFSTIPLFLESPIVKLDYENLLPKIILMGVVGFIVAYFNKWKSKELIMSVIFFGFVPIINIDISTDFTYTLNVFYPAYKFNKSQILLESGTLVNWGLALLKSIFYVGLGYLYLDFFQRKTPNITTDSNTKNHIKLFIYKTLLYASVSGIVLVLLGQNTFPIFSNKIAQTLFGLGFLYFVGILIYHSRHLLEQCFYNDYQTNNLLLFLASIPFIDIVVLVILKNVPLVKSISIKPQAAKLVIASVLVFYAIVQFFITIRTLPNSSADLRIALTFAHVAIPIILALLIYFLANTHLIILVLLVFVVGLIPLLLFYLIPTIEQNGSFDMLLFTVNMLLHIPVFLFLVFPFSTNRNK